LQKKLNICPHKKKLKKKMSIITVHVRTLDNKQIDITVNKDVRVHILTVPIAPYDERHMCKRINFFTQGQID